MMKTSARPGAVLTVPLVLLSVGLLEAVATYKVRQHLRDVHVRVAIMLALNGVAFAIAATWVTPAIRRLLVSIRQSSRRGGGLFGLWLFYAAAYGGLYWAYLVMERHGAGHLLPAAWR
jgi:hypothetical protein